MAISGHSAAALQEPKQHARALCPAQQRSRVSPQIDQQAQPQLAEERASSTQGRASDVGSWDWHSSTPLSLQAAWAEQQGEGYSQLQQLWAQAVQLCLSDGQGCLVGGPAHGAHLQMPVTASGWSRQGLPVGVPWGCMHSMLL